MPLSDSLCGISHVTNAVGAMATSVQRKAQHLLSAHAQAYSGTTAAGFEQTKTRHASLEDLRTGPRHSFCWELELSATLIRGL